jgi:hypothetical protein
VLMRGRSWGFERVGGIGRKDVSPSVTFRTTSKPWNSQIELHLPSAYHNSPLLPPHTFRTGDPARLEANPSNANAASKKKVKPTTDGESEGVEGVVAKVRFPSF